MMDKEIKKKFEEIDARLSIFETAVKQIGKDVTNNSLEIAKLKTQKKVEK